MSIIEKLRRKTYQPLNTITVSAKALRHNYTVLSELDASLAVAPVLKSNAYGHGISIVSKILDSSQAPFVCVDSLFEAYQLKKQKIKTPILIMGAVDPHSLQAPTLPFAFAVYDLDHIKALATNQPRSHIHIFVDTGMHREGIDISFLHECIEYVTQKTTLCIEGLMSHFAMSQSPDNPQTRQQIERFTKAQEILKTFNVNPKWIHIANSAALLHHNAYAGKLGNVARTGLALYGYDSVGLCPDLVPVLELKTHVVQIKEVKKNEYIGYDCTYLAKHDMKIGILPIGYYDGVDRRLSSQGYVSINNQFCPIVGIVSMNISTIDITNVKECEVGSEVTVFSSRKDSKNAIMVAATLCSTIPYDLLVHLSSTKRISIDL